MDTEILAAAILTAGFVNAERAALHSGRLDDNIREKFVEYLAFVHKQAAAVRSGKKPRKPRSR